MNYKIFSKLISFLPPEFLHTLFLKFLQMEIYKSDQEFDNLKINALGHNFNNPLGLAAGFDKNAESIMGAFNLGFGFTEVGTVTPMPQLGNPKPRVFKIPEFDAVIQRLGFNNKGLEAFLSNLKKLPDLEKILGVNIGKNKNSGDLFEDYIFLYEKLKIHADYITINISSPNTPGLREIQEKGNIEKLLKKISKIKDKRPTLLKLSPDISMKNLENICKLALEYDFINGLVLTNTTISRESLYKKQCKNSWKILEDGGLSGPPLRERANEIIKTTYQLTNGRLLIVGVGGISNAKDVFEKISFGASLVQIYTVLIYKGPGVVIKILTELSELLKKKGLKNMNELIGKNVKYD